MSEDFRPELFRIVLDDLSRHPGKRARRRVWDAIWAAHNGRPDGYLVTSDNQWMFRAYRNAISPNPDHMIDAALAWKEAQDAVPNL